MISQEEAYSRHLLNKDILNLCNKFSTPSSCFMLSRSIFNGILEAYPLFRTKLEIIADSIYILIRKRELILDENDAEKYINELFSLFERHYQSKDFKYSKKETDEYVGFEYLGEKIKLSKFRSNIYLKYITEQELFNSLLYHSYINDFPETLITLNSEYLLKIIKLMNKPNKIEIINKYLNSSMILSEIDEKFYIKTFSKTTDKKFNYLGHVFSDKFFDNCIVLVNLITFFSLKFFLINEVIANAFKKYTNITFFIVDFSKGITLVKNLFDKKYTKFEKRYKNIGFTFMDKTPMKRGVTITHFIVLSNDPDSDSKNFNSIFEELE